MSLHELSVPSYGLLSQTQQRRLARLRRITGFVTVYGEQQDPRLALFARLWHVQRVVMVARLLCRRHHRLDAKAVERLVWLHDLNRWPFAHNAENGRFDQVGNLEAYWAGDDDITGQDLADLAAIHQNATDAASDAARLVLLADTITGLIEDPLMAVIGLNVHPRLVPECIDEQLGYSLGGGDQLRICQDLAATFHGRAPVPMPQVSAVFHKVFTTLVQCFLLKHRKENTWADHARMLAIARQIRRSFMEPVIFPLNNELVCRGSWISGTVMPWYLARTDRAADRLLQIDEPGFVAEVTTLAGSPFQSEQFVPDLDAVTRTRPDLVFVAVPQGDEAALEPAAADRRA